MRLDTHKLRFQIKNRVLVVVSILLFSLSAHAQNKVVVVPMFDEIETGNTHHGQLVFVDDPVATSITTNYQQFIDFGIYEKSSNETLLRIEFRAPVRLSGSVGQFVEFQLRVGGVAVRDYSGAVIWQNQSGHYELLSTSELFSGLESGAHSIQLFIRGNSDQVHFNFGLFDTVVNLYEFLPLNPNNQTTQSGSSIIRKHSSHNGLRGGIPSY